MRYLLSTLLLFLTLNLFANEPMLRETQYQYVASSIGKGKPYFLEVGSDSCHSCQIMGKLLYKVHKKYPQYEIHFINVKKEREAAYALKIQMIPTQLIFDAQGREVYRHVGLLTTNDLMKTLHQYLDQE